MRGALVIALVLAAPIARAADMGADLLIAARKGKTGEVQALLDHGAPIGATDRKGHTALMLAAQGGHPDTVQLLLSKGARANDRDEEGYTAYGLALLAPSKH